jgi:Concanavalin A-like lectin/glucanases superfamily
VRLDAGNEAPTPVIDAPSLDYRFGVGEPIALRGRATDPEDGPLGSSQLSWKVTRVHDNHTHPYVPATSAGELTIPGAAPEDILATTNSYLVVELTATDSTGLSRTVSRELRPALVDVTITTEPLGRTVEVNGMTIVGPTSITSWRGYELNVSAPPQTDGQGGGWHFQSWSDGGGSSHQIVTPATASTYAATFQPGAPPQTGLVAAFGFGEGSGVVVGDASGFGNVGSVSGAVWGVGRHGGGLVFDGVNDWVSVADHGSLDVSSGLTLEAWVRPSGGSSWRTVVLKERSGGLVYGLYERTGSRGPSGHVQVGGGEPRARASGLLPVGVWSHLASTFDGSVVRVFVNGVQVASSSAVGVVGVSGGVLRLGGNAVWSEWFAGTLDDVRVYSRALSPAQIQTDMNVAVG